MVVDIEIGDVEFTVVEYYQDRIITSVFQPVFEACEPKLAGKKVALFGSYGWGDGDWMRSWEEKCQNDGVALAADSVICNEEPDDEAQTACIELGKVIC